MVKKDHLDNEVAVSVEVTGTGVQARSKSRLVSGLDRLVGNASDWLNARIEDDISTRRAITEGKKKLIEASAKEAVRRIGTDSAFADRAIEGHFERVLASQANRDAVAEKVLEDLRSAPPSEEQSRSGPDEIAPEILDRIDTFASGASTPEIQERWARVISAEVRKPGTFSLKVLRIIDELDQEVALLFEEFCRDRLWRYVPRVLHPELKYGNQIRLVDAGLLVNPGMGQSTSLMEATLNGTEYWLWRPGGQDILGIPKADFKPSHELGSKKALQTHDEKPAVPVYILTDAGLAICEILPPVSNEGRYFSELKSLYGNARRWRLSPQEDTMVDVTDV